MFEPTANPRAERKREGPRTDVINTPPREGASPRWERKREELRGEIVDAAFAEFSARGYHQTGIADIAKRLGLGHGTFYRYFASKRDILDHVLDDLIVHVQSVVSAENAPNRASNLAEYRAQCERIAAALGALFGDDPRVARMLLFEATSIDSALTNRLQDLLAHAASLVAAYFETGIERGFVRADLAIRETAEAVVGMILAGALRMLRDAADRDARRAYELAAIRLLLEGVAAPQSGEPNPATARTPRRRARARTPSKR
jgi:AcrR family transcriptional regulator